jgi:hypothetical protein
LKFTIFVFLWPSTAQKLLKFPQIFGFSPSLSRMLTASLVSPFGLLWLALGALSALGLVAG